MRTRSAETGSGIDASSVEWHRSVSDPHWSPTGTHIAYIVPRNDGDRFNVRVVELASGSVTTVLGDHQEGGWPYYAWSASGDRILFSMRDANARPSLWSVDLTGADRRLVVAGPSVGAWQWDPPAP